jgi:hypothetical protein
MRRATVAVLVVGTLAVVAYDVVAAIVGGTDATISGVVRDAAGVFPPLAFAFGVLGGHFFWNGREVVRPRWMAVLILAASAAALAALSVAFYRGDPAWAPLACLGGGIGAGRLLWPLEVPRRP